MTSDSKQDISAAPTAAISLPKGGGAIRGIGEKFAANPATGTGSMSMPVATSPGRSGFGPTLSLSYDSGSGNGPFGFGWSLSLPAIARKIDMGLPRYQDAAESDVFVLAGSEDLVPADRLEEEIDGYLVRRYRPRVESAFLRIERWSRIGVSGDVHWRSITGDNLLTIYGLDSNSRISDPADPGRIFSWLICETRDDRGNAMLYRYRADDGTGVDLTQAHERNRGSAGDTRRTTNRYLKRIRYGNREPLLAAVTGQRPRFLTPAQVSAASWMFEVVFDYGDHDLDDPAPAGFENWPTRPDCFSSYRSGFEVRTSRLCRRVLMFHHFPDAPEVGLNCLVRSTDLTHDVDIDPADAHTPVYAFLRTVTQTGYRRDGTALERRSMPPVEFEYTGAFVSGTVEDLDPGSLENLPAGLDSGGYLWTDLHGEGVPGILTEQGGNWFYKRNLSEARFAPVETVARRSAATLEEGAQLVDLDGDGRPDLVLPDGWYAHDEAEGWGPFRPFAGRAGLDLQDPNVRLVDLDGDGHADILITEDDALVWYPSRAGDGFGPARRVAMPHDEETGPRVVFADPLQSVHVADLSGDGLGDLVRIRNGDVCYWPNLGHGRFGAKVTMDNAPWFDRPDTFDQRRLRLADIDGSGTTDLIYLGNDGVRLYFNQCGNAWSRPQRLSAFPRVDDVVGVVPVDLLGNGTACLVWSSGAPGDARRPMRYVRLMETKPHLLTTAINNLGAEVHLEYRPSSAFYLRDKSAGRPWLTRLPMPVHVIERVITFDHVNRSRFVTRYAYHDGFFDGVEREFRGFGLVEQWDSGEIAGDGPSPAVLTKTWWHTGAGPGGGHFREPGLTDAEAEALRLPGPALPTGLSPEEEREALRSLKGSMLRQEVYADGDTVPYAVTEQHFAVRTLQARDSRRHGAFLVHPLEKLETLYERSPTDPRVRHTLTLEVDPHGIVLKQCVAGYGRRRQVRVVTAAGQVQLVPNPALAALSVTDRSRQTTSLVIYTETTVTNDVDTAVAYRKPLPCQTLTYELTDYPATGPAGRFRAADLVEQHPAGGLRHRFTDEAEYEDQPTGNACRRPVEQVRTLYRRDDLTALLPLGRIADLGLPGERYALALTPGLIAEVLPELLPDPATVLGAQGGYLRGQELKADGRFPATDPGDRWWVPSGRSFYTTDPADTPATELTAARQHFFLPRRTRDPFGQHTAVDLDDDDLLAVESRDAAGNKVTADVNDYRVLQPRLVSDPNRNRTEVVYDTLGLVVGTAVMGKPAPAPAEGDTLTGFDADLTQTQLDAFFDAADPHPRAAALLLGASTRMVHDLHRFRRTRQAHPTDPDRWEPAGTATLARETHVNAPLPPHGLRIGVEFSYSDGFGREIQKKLTAEPDNGGPRWIGSGWTIYDGKGRPVRKFEPFFSARRDHRFEFGVTTGVSPVLCYDPPGRVVATLHPHHAYEKVVFDAWQQTAHDVNDTCLHDPRTDPDVKELLAGHLAGVQGWKTWRELRIGGGLGANEQTAAQRAAAHAGTPTTVHLDPLGRTFLTVTRNRLVCTGHDLDGTEETVLTRVELDIEGNQSTVSDEHRTLFQYTRDLLGNPIRQISLDAGTRWTLIDVSGKPIRRWDSRGHTVTIGYDALRRPLTRTVRGSTAASDPRTLNKDIVTDRTEYGDPSPGASQADRDRAIRLNLHGRIERRLDTAGTETVEEYDFQGNARRTTRRLLADHKALPDWSQSPTLFTETFQNSSRYDALNRVIQSVAGRWHVVQPVYNEANLLERLDVWLERTTEPTGLLDPATEAPDRAGVAGIAYDARGQRLRIDYGNGATTHYRYDPETFRLAHLYTRRGAAFTADCENSQPPPATVAAPETPPDGRACGLQNLHYTYDPAGNLTHVRDDAQQTIFFDNKRVEPSCDYTYDASYRLIQATGREHLGQLPPTAPDAFNAFHTRLQHPGNGDLLGTYIERYVYDSAGNILRTQHRRTDLAQPGWTQAYDYDGISNRLASTTLGANNPETYKHDENGNMVRLPHLGSEDNVHWDYADRLRQTDRVDGSTVHYAYDAAGHRVRKVWEKSPGILEERIYLGGFELFRRHDGGLILERETLHVTGDAQRTALVEIRTIGTDQGPSRLIRFQYGNHVGSANLELDDQAQIISYEEYAPYGSTMYQAVRSDTETPKRYRYTGRERDEETGLTYHGARYYAPWLARWTACDPAGTVDGPNLYAYVTGNPIVLSDPTGQQSLGSDPQELIRSMMWDQLGQDLAAHVEAIFGGKSYINPRANEIDYSGPKGGVGGLVGGVVRAATLRTVPIENEPSISSIAGMEVGAAAVPVLDPAARLLTAETVTHAPASRKDAAVALALDLVPSAMSKLATLEARALSLESRAVSAGRGSTLGIVAHEEGTFVRIPGAKTEKVASNIELDIGRRAVRIEKEISRVARGGKIEIRVGKRTEVSLGPAGPDVTSTSHVHQESGVAFPSAGDTEAFFKSGYSPNTRHTIVGVKWPHLSREAAAQGLKPPPTKFMKTTFFQHQIPNPKEAEKFILNLFSP